MKINITNLYGMANTSTAQAAQNVTAQLAKDQGANELAIYRYNVASDSPEQLRVRIDGINASLQMGDIVIFQLPTWNGLEFERQYLNQLRLYQTRIVFFIQDVPPLMFSQNYADWMRPYVEFFNEADLLILPSENMAARLRAEGLTVDNIVYQHLWDHPTTYQPEMAAFRRELTFLGSQSRFPFTREWSYQTRLRLFAADAQADPDQNIDYVGFHPESALLPMLDGGFGLCWSIDTPEQPERQYSHLNASYKLSTYLAAGLPVVANADIAAAELIKDRHLGLLAESLAEADQLVQNCTAEDYQRMAQNAKDYGYLLRNGYMFKRMLVEVVEKLLVK
ncbi:sugar transferase [Limosilactobacillus reuteri]|uniref:sugar transferase n=1 Tax=Limosilactobacillus reuteri TaxID=1598 RepID=UPI001E569BF5|nr:sugar transferase [Limosilactobacillus reuteri]UFK65170.1 Glucosyltransferase 3 [Limosilactobacillus reuteri]UFK67916.1 Glucosyltransferase 3 [Limosilactobacillus reuteri]